MIREIAHAVERQLGYVTRGECPANEMKACKVRGGGKFLNSKLIFLLFCGQESLPRYVVKIADRYAKPNLIIDEFIRLKEVRAICQGHFCEEAIPQPLGIVDVAGEPASVESFISGERLHSRASDPERRHVIDWLIDFHLRARQEGTLDRRGLIQWLKEFVSEAPLLSENREFDAFVERVVYALFPVEVALPRLRQHGDFHYDNIFFADVKIRVIDWGNFGRIIVPGYDLFYLCKRFVHQERNRPLIDKYLKSVSIDPGLAAGLRRLTDLLEEMNKWASGNAPLYEAELTKLIRDFIPSS